MYESTQEDISVNPFFKTLTLKFPKLYERAEKSCWIICVPKAASLRGLRSVAEDDFLNHILQPSKFYQGVFDTLNKKNVEIEDNHIITKSGFKVVRKIKILFEELFYNKEYKPFRVLCIEHMLEGGPDPSNEDSIPSIKFPSSRSFQDCKTFLDSNQINQIVLSKINDQIRDFNKTYIIVKGFEDHATKRVQPIYEQAIEALLIANPDYRIFHRNNDPQLLQLEEVVESYVMGMLYERLFTGLSSIHGSEDEAMHRRLMLLQDISQNDLGIRDELQHPIPEAAEAMKLIETYTTPLQMLYGLQEVTTIITRVLSAQPTTDAITTDDLIPLMSEAIIHSKLKKVITILYYIEYFIFSNINATSLGFTLVTFKAAIEYVKGSQLTGFIKGLTIDEDFRKLETIAILPTASPQRSYISDNNSPIRPAVREYPLISDNKRVSLNFSNEIPAPTRIAPPTAYQQPPDVIVLDKKNDLGDFLSSLKNSSSSRW